MNQAFRLSSSNDRRWKRAFRQGGRIPGLFIQGDHALGFINRSTGADEAEGASRRWQRQDGATAGKGQTLGW
jgi:hypothetical protein